MSIKNVLIFLTLLFTQSIICNAVELFYIDTCVVDKNDTYSKEIPASATYLFLDMNVALSNNGDGFGYNKSEWGITWSQSHHGYYQITFKCGNTDYGDLSDIRYMDIVVSKVQNGKAETINKYHITNGLDMYLGFNRFSIEIYKHELRIFGGNKDVFNIGNVKIDSNPGGTFTIFSNNTKLNIQPIAGEYELDKIKFLASKYQDENILNLHIEKSKNPIVGYWKYLDRNNDPDRARPGGYYRLAIVEDDGGYLILYISDAEVNKIQWQTGMIKGRLIPTIFRDHYDLVWYDADMEEISRDIHASIINNVILSLEFPLYKTTLRFSKE